MSVSVSKLVGYLKNKLDSDLKLQNIEVVGELSNVSGGNPHLYFTLKDESASISCAMFYQACRLLTFKPKDGDKVIVTGRVSMYEKLGRTQFYVDKMKLAGVGDLHEQYELLKKKLDEQGYFDDGHKKELEVKYPEKVCVLVGDNSAAMSDIKTCFKRRWPICEVDYYPVLVQGDNAAKDIILNLNKVDELGYDYIILARGGGSFEDLFCFNDENLVKTIYNLKTFIVSAVGHEQDFTLCDFVSDLRAPTPTASVELTTPNINDVMIEIDETINYLYSFIINRFNNIKLLYENYASKINNYASNIKILFNDILNSKKELDNLISQKINLTKIDVDSCDKDICNLVNHKIDIARKDLDATINLINAYSIDNSLKRGFSIVYKDNKIINDTTKIKTNDIIKVKMYKGEKRLSVKEEA